MESNYSKNPEVCPNCYIGRIARQTKSLVTMLDGEPVTFPDFPAWVCDVCHAFVYDPEALAHVQSILTSKNRLTPGFPERKPSVKRHKLRKPSKPKSLDQK